MGILNKEKKGMKCREDPTTGLKSCERVVRDSKTGELMGDGQSFKVRADPSTGCKPSLEDPTIMDDDWDQVDKMAKKISEGCKRN